MEIIDRLSDTTYIALIHDVDYQPPDSIRDFCALSREVLLNGKRTPFYFGTGPNDTRVNFHFADVWWHITRGDQNLDENGEHRNLFPLLFDIDNEFDFITVGPH